MAERFQDHVDELRTHTSEWLRGERARVVSERRRLEVRELAITRVLDERATRDREAEDDLIGVSRDSARTARQKVEVARALESLPAIAAKAEAGELSWEQLEPVTRLATPETDAEWAERAPRYAPTDLSRLARVATPVSPEEQAKRQAASELRWWDDHERGGVALRGFLPDVDGVLAKNVLERMIGRMKPPPGQPWDPITRRGADAFIELCTRFADAETTGKHKPLIVLHRNSDGNAARSDSDTAPLAMPIPMTPGGGIAPEVHETRVEDPTEPEAREQGLVHREAPDGAGSSVSGSHLGEWIGTTSRKSVVKACNDHHPLLEPHGPYRLVGDPDLPDGIRVIDTRVTAANDARAGPAP